MFLAKSIRASVISINSSQQCHKNVILEWRQQFNGNINGNVKQAVNWIWTLKNSNNRISRYDFWKMTGGVMVVWLDYNLNPWALAWIFACIARLERCSKIKERAPCFKVRRFFLVSLCILCGLVSLRAISFRIKVARVSGDQKRRWIPARFIIPLAVWREIILLSTVIGNLVIGLNQMSWSPLPCRKK